MFRKIRHSFNNLTLKAKIFFILLVTIFFLSLTFIFGLNWIEQVYRNHLYESVAARLTYSGQEISTKLQTIENVSQMILSRDAIQNDLYIIKTSDDFQKRSAANEELRALLSYYNDTFRDNNIRYINLYCDFFKTSANTYASQRVPDEIHNYVRGVAQEHEGAPVWIMDYASSRGLFLGRQIRQIKGLSLRPLGEVVINVNLEEMIAQTSVFNEKFEDYAYLLLSGDKVVYHSPELTAAQARYVQSVLDEDYRVIDLNGKKYFSVLSRLPLYGWDYICLQAYDDIVDALRQARTQLILVLIVMGLVTLAVSFWVIDSTTRHFRILANRMLTLGEKPDPNDRPSYDYASRKDEVGILHQQFDQMIVRLDHLIQINYVNELMKKEAQLQALENQINPHFLYNTLESVNWRARMVGADDISEMVQALASLLRVTLNKNSSAYELGQELELVHNYMVIQHYRFEDRLQYTIDAPEAARRLLIPKLILQPLVENAIHYGLENSIDDCSIRIVARVQDGQLRIQVRNTGSAFEPNLLAQLKDQTIQPQGHGIALLNIAERLQLTYGDAGQLNLYNQEDWAVAEIILPVETR